MLNSISKSNSFGFSALEVVITISFLLVILSIGIGSLRDVSSRRDLESTANNIVSKLELARTNAVTGKGGQNYGIKFNNDSFIYFAGSSFIESNENNKQINISSGLEIETDIPGPTETVIFSRITGETNFGQNLTITIRDRSNSDNRIDVVIGILGEISMVK